MRIVLNKIILCFLIAIASTSFCFAQDVATQKTDERQAYINATIYTADQTHPTAQAMVTENGKIIYVGSNQEAEKLVPTAAQVKNLQGRLVLPAFSDTHCHPAFFAGFIGSNFFVIDKDWSKETVLREMQKFSAEHPELPKIIGFGYDGFTPIAKDLDQIDTKRPVLLVDSGGHGASINTTAMKALGLTKETPDPMPGVQYFERYADGTPTGHLVEGMACDFAWTGLGIFSEESIYKSLPDLLAYYSSMGITSVSDCGMFSFAHEGHRALNRLEKEDRLPMYYVTSSFVRPTDSVGDAMRNLRDLQQYTSTLIHPRVMKMQNDGTIENYTAYMNQPYADLKEQRGLQFFSVDRMTAFSEAATREGFDVHIHAIGDQAISDTLTAFERLQNKVIRPTNHRTIAHGQVMPADGVQRLAALKDVFYQTTPVWIAADDYTENQLGPERFLRQVPLGSLHASGVKMTFGSDCPASDGKYGIDPFINIQYAVIRSEGNNSITMPPRTEGLDVSAAIDAYTINAAEQLGLDTETGSIVPGKSADFIVLDQNIFHIPTDSIYKTRVLFTYFRGNLVYQADDSELKNANAR